MIAALEVGAADRALEQNVADQRQLRRRMMEDDMARRVAGAVADGEFQLADGHRVAVGQPAIRGEWPSDYSYLAPSSTRRSIQKRSSSCGPSIGTPSSSAKIPALPQWSMWPWVSRIFSIVTPGLRGRRP